MRTAEKKEWPPGHEGSAEAAEENKIKDDHILAGKPGPRAPIPDELRSLPGWLIWQREQHPGEPKPRKVPYYAKGGRRHGVQGSQEDRSKLTTYDAAIEAARDRDYDGVGLALMPEFGLVALDFDECVKDGQPIHEVEALVAGTYAELSPSGHGVRAFMRGHLDDHKSRAEGGRFGFETFSSKGFVTVTGNVLAITELLGTENTVAPVSDEVRALCAARFGSRMNSSSAPETSDPLMTYEPRVGLTEAQIASTLAAMDPDTGHDTWLHIGMAIHHETDGEGFDLWDAWSAKGTKYPSEEALRRRWDSFGRMAGAPVTARYLLKLAAERGVKVSPSADGRQTKFELIPAHIFAAGTPPAWIVKGLLPQAETAVVYGESGSGKSFFVLDLVEAVARGVPWQGRRTKQGPVVYVAAEGAGGFRKRLTAYAKHYGVNLAEIPLSVVSAAPNLLSGDDKALGEVIAASGGASIVVIDTLAQTTPGANENAGEDMGKALASCKRLHAATGALIVLVHHAGKDLSKGARGWSGIRAAVDAEIEIAKLADARVARVTKQKDGEDGEVFAFTLPQVMIGMDEDGDPITSCVVAFQDAMPTTFKEPSGKNQRAIWQLANDLAGVAGVVDIAELIKAAVPHFEPGEGRDRRREHIQRTIDALVERAFFYIEDGRLILPQTPNAPQI